MRRRVSIVAVVASGLNRRVSIVASPSSFFPWKIQNSKFGRECGEILKFEFCGVGSQSSSVAVVAVVASPSSRRARRVLLLPSLHNSKFKLWPRMRPISFFLRAGHRSQLVRWRSLQCRFLLWNTNTRVNHRHDNSHGDHNFLF